jgi:hypothetical protein
MWKEETEEVKEHFEHLAYIERERHAAQFPGWKCTPRKPKDIKRRAKKAKSLTIVRATAPPTLRLPPAPKPSAKVLENSIRVGISMSGSTMVSIPLSGDLESMARRLQNASTINGICDDNLPARDLSWIDTFEDDCRQITQDYAEMGRAQTPRLNPNCLHISIILPQKSTTLPQAITTRLLMPLETLATMLKTLLNSWLSPHTSRNWVLQRSSWDTM